MFVTENGGDPAEKDPKKPVTEQSELDEDFVGDPEEDEEAFDEEESEDENAEDEDPDEDEDADEDEESDEYAEDEESEDDGESEDENEEDGESEEDETSGEDQSGDEASDGEGTEETDAGHADGAGEEKPAADAALKAQIRATMKALGFEEVDTVEGLQRVAATAKGISVEEYLKNEKEQRAIQAAKDFIRRGEEEEMLARDLADIQKAFPFMSDLKSIRELPHLKEFGKMMDDAGGKISASAAFAATHADIIMKKTAEITKRQSLDGTKSHLHSSAPKKAKDDGVTITRGEMREWRAMFPEKTDKEIIAIYKRTKSK